MLMIKLWFVLLAFSFLFFFLISLFIPMSYIMPFEKKRREA